MMEYVIIKEKEDRRVFKPLKQPITDEDIRRIEVRYGAEYTGKGYTKTTKGEWVKVYRFKKVE